MLSLTASTMCAVASRLTQRDHAALACAHPVLLEGAGEWWTSAELSIDSQKSADDFQAWVDRVKPGLKRLRVEFAAVGPNTYPDYPDIPKPECMDHLTIFHRHNDGAHVHSAALADFIQKFPNLQSLEMYAAMDVMDDDVLPKPAFPMNEYDPTMGSFISTDDLDRILRACPKLIKLTVSVTSVENISLANLEDLTLCIKDSPALVDLTGCPNLGTLRLEGYMNDNSIGTILCPPATHTLTAVNFTDVDTLSAPGLVDARFKWIGTHERNTGMHAIAEGNLGISKATAKNIKSLWISFSSFEDSHDSFPLMTGIESLTMEELDDSPDCTSPDGWMSRLVNLKKLIFIDVAHCTPCFPKGRLEFLELSDLEVLPGDLAGMPALKHLCMNHYDFHHDFFPEVAGIKELVLYGSVLPDSDWGVLSPSLETLVFRFHDYEQDSKQELEAANWPRRYLDIPGVKTMLLETPQGWDWVLPMVEDLPPDTYAMHSFIHPTMITYTHGGTQRMTVTQIRKV